MSEHVELGAVTVAPAVVGLAHEASGLAVAGMQRDASDGHDGVVTQGVLTPDLPIDFGTDLEARIAAATAEAEAGPEATLHDDPEAALPTTDGELEDLASDVTEVTGDSRDFPRESAPTSPYEGANTTATLEDLRPAWLEPGNSSGGDRFQAHVQGNAEIATMAQAFLKHGMKVFSPDEQRALINEGVNDGVTARNLDGLDLEGTHYKLLDKDDPHVDAFWL